MSNLNEETEEGFYVERFDTTYKSFEHYVSSIDQDTFLQYEFCAPFLTQIHEEMTDAYADYKRGYEEWLYIFEEDYAETGRKRPRKADRKYYGVSICRYNMGDYGEYSGFQPYELQTRRVTVKEWKLIN